jgi:glycosyltransferase involved in cell wall biosynthesis
VKILIISPTQSGIGGTAKHVQGLTNYLKSKNHFVKIISSENTFTIPIKKLKNPSFMLSALIKTKFSKNYDIIHAHHPMAALAFKGSSAKKVVTFHGVFNNQIEMLHGKTAQNLSHKYEQNALKWADAVTAGSTESFNYYSKLESKVFFVPNAIDIDSLSSEVNTRYDKQIIFVGRLSKEKGIHTVIKTAKNLPNEIDLIIVGSGPEENFVVESIKNHKNIHYLGYQPKEKTIPLIRGSKLLIQPSLAEGISGSLLEAMACKTPVITTNIGGNVELFENNKSGILIEPENSEELLKKIVSLLDNPVKLEQISNSAFNTVQQYDWSNIGKKYLDLYEKLLHL